MNLIHSGAREIMHDWFDVFSKFLDIPEFLIQFQNLENLDLFFLRTIKNTPFESSKDLITLLHKVCTIPAINKKLFEKDTAEALTLQLAQSVQNDPDSNSLLLDIL